jgi:hypothetical protein
MPPWASAAMFATLVVVFPYTLIFRILLQLPKPIVLSHRRWPLYLNLLVIGAITGWVTVFIHSLYYARGSPNPFAMLMEFVISALAYAFGLVLILRQFSGLYPEFFVSTGRTGLALRKTAYRNVTKIEEVARAHGESHLRVETSYGLVVPLTLPTRHVPSLYERVKPTL